MSWVTLFWHCTRRAASRTDCTAGSSKAIRTPMMAIRSEEHTSELQSQSNLVCRLLLEKKKNTTNADTSYEIQQRLVDLDYHVVLPRPPALARIAMADAAVCHAAPGTMRAAFRRE